MPKSFFFPSGMEGSFRSRSLGDAIWVYQGPSLLRVTACSLSLSLSVDAPSNAIANWNQREIINRRDGHN